MTWLAPAWLAVGALAAAAIALLHLITTQRPPVALLPTARFVPGGKARAAAMAKRPTDLVLLAMRMLAVLLLGAAFARPVPRGGGPALGRVVLVDRTLAAGRAASDSAAAMFRAGDEIVALATAAAATGAERRAAGVLSAGIVAAARAAARVALRADSIELVIVSPVLLDEMDGATAELIGRWPGRVRVVRTAALSETAADVQFAGGVGDDWMRPVVDVVNATAPAGSRRVPVRVMRGEPSAADSAAATAGAAVVVWPASGSATGVARGVWAPGATLVAPLAAMAVPLGDGVAVVARWADGAPAATEHALGEGCVRHVGIGVPEAGDIALQPAFAGIAARLLAPCGAAMGGGRRAAGDSLAGSLARGGAAAMAAAFIEREQRSIVAPWLAGAALLLLVGEMWVRRAKGEGRGTTGDGRWAMDDGRHGNPR